MKKVMLAVLAGVVAISAMAAADETKNLTIVKSTKANVVEAKAQNNVPAALVPVDGSVVSASVHEVTYLSEAKADGSLAPGSAWAGTKVLRFPNGTCVKVVHRELTIVQVGDVQVPEFTEEKTPVDCPT